jgi:hypothetical protein
MSIYEAKIGALKQEDCDARMSEFKRSIAGTPKGSSVRDRRAVGPENSEFYKLKRFLDLLLDM